MRSCYLAHGSLKPDLVQGLSWALATLLTASTATTTKATRSINIMRLTMFHPFPLLVFSTIPQGLYRPLAGSRLHHWLRSSLRCPTFGTKFSASTALLLIATVPEICSYVHDANGLFLDHFSMWG